MVKKSNSGDFVPGAAGYSADFGKAVTLNTIPSVSLDEKEARHSVQTYLVSKSVDEDSTSKGLLRNRGKEAWILVLRAYAEGMPVSKIVDLIKERWNFKLTINMVNGIVGSKAAQVYIKGFHDEFMSKVLDVPIANKRVRIDNHQTHFNILSKEINILSAIEGKNATDHAALVRLITQATTLQSEVREEMEKRPTVFNHVNVSMNGMTDEQLYRRKQELIGSVRRAEGRGTFGTAPDTDGSGAEAEIEPS